jgi:hypothetical protein
MWIGSKLVPGNIAVNKQTSNGGNNLSKHTEKFEQKRSQNQT